MRLTWEQSIVKSIQEDPHRTVWKYVFPRRTGATTFMTLLANREYEDGKRVLFVALNHNGVSQLKSGIVDLDGLYPVTKINPYIDLLSAESISLPDNKSLRGKTYDWVFVDNGSYCRNKDALANILMPCIGPNGHLLWIDTQ